MTGVRDTKLSGPIIFFDDVCGFCNRSIRLLLKIDRRHILKFAPLQGRTALEFLGSSAASSDTIVLYHHGQLLERADAIIESIASLGGFWRVIRLSYILPGPIRNGLYRFVARNRYRLFGKEESCSIPSPREREQFLD